MAKVCSITMIAAADASCSPYISSKREAFTVWMKSLVMQGNGCTVIDKKGEVAYRIDNYQSKCSGEVLLMDLHGNVLFTLVQRKLRAFGRWEGFKPRGSDENDQKLWFLFKKGFSIFSRKLSCHVSLCSGKARSECYRIEGMPGKPEFGIFDKAGGIIAEVKRKQSSSSGAYLGDDVLALVVEPGVDQSLIMALVALYASTCQGM